MVLLVCRLALHMVLLACCLAFHMVLLACRLVFHIVLHVATVLLVDVNSEWNSSWRAGVLENTQLSLLPLAVNHNFISLNLP